MKVVVLGAGVVGTASAWYLSRAGHDVTVLDRQAEPALETSFANGGQISVSHAEPWANPTAPFQVLQWLGREDAPLLFRPRADLDQWLWGARFLFECLPGRTRRNSEAAFALASYSRDCLGVLRRETGIRYDQSERGILHIYTARGLFEHAHKEVALLRARGFDVAIKSADECVAIEPALAHAKARLYGGAYAASDESGDAHLFTQRLAALARQQGVEFRFNVSVNRIELDAGQVSRVVIDDEVGIEESVRADAFVVALGSYSRPALRGIGISLPIYPVKGYSITIALEPGDEAPAVSLTDHERKIVISRLGDRLRVAGTAELAGYDTEINEVRCQALVRRCFELFPKAGNPDAAQYWTGLRPATPSNLPIIGRTRFPNLYLNTGHGTLGWTMACGAGQALADILCAKTPVPNFRFLGVERS
jgi:D-amino-acid dehydrogenase